MSEIAADFENIVLSELNKAWHSNVRRFKWDSSGIIAPHFRITEASVSHWGQWATATREMSFSRHLVTKRPWSEVLEVLKHEMAHQYVHEVLKVNGEAPHGPAFKAVCKQFNIDAAVRGVPGADKVTATNHIVEKIRHLLTLASNAGATEAEAQAAAEAAHNMMLKYNIELQEKNEDLGYTVRYLGDITGRIQGYMSELANLLTKYYFVEIIWMSTHDPRNKKKGHELEVSGTEENVEVAEYVYEFISRAAVGTWENKMKDPAFKLSLHQEFARSFGRGTAPQSIQGFTISARSNFLLGFIRGFKEQLKKAEIKEQAAGLVVRKDPFLEEFYHVRHPHIRNIGRSAGYYNSTMQGQGFAEGQALKLPPAVQASKTFTPLLGK
jgi:hypothetical protein